MVRRWQHHEYHEELNVSTAFTDLMSNAFMILLLFLLLAIVTSFINKNVGVTDTPPIIVIQDEGAYRFASGSATIPPAMLNYIARQIVPEIEGRTQEYNINIVEIIGHTDGQPNGNVASNLDLNLENVARGALPVGKLQAGSNADLGLMRALAVVQVLRNIQLKEQRLQGLSFRAYSAAQLILPSGEFAAIARQEDQTRRRIEIRFTRLGKVQEVK
ncbi:MULTISPECIES: flagellar motor protein [unclassified Anabaena]|jgi:flagellar motor protein MotB|uniref:flagellar motor protein n=1 Tax=unclassified Anabaena TaxID=2619674 RepID=UPI0039C5D0C8